MSTKILDVDDRGRRPQYVGWRGELLAELALTRIPGLSINKKGQDRPDFELGYDFLVATRHGLCFFVRVQAFSTLRLGIAGPEAMSEWRWRVETDLVRRARRSRSPYLLFLFDADTEQGRYVRLDALAEPGAHEREVAVRLPVENVIDRENLAALIAGLERERKP